MPILYSITREEIFEDLKLFPPDVYKRTTIINQLKSWTAQDLRSIIDNNPSLKVITFSEERQTGKTTQKVIDAIYFKYQNMNINFVCRTYGCAKRVESTYSNYIQILKKKLKYQIIPSGKVYFTSRLSTSSQLRGIKIDQIIHDLD